MRTSTYREIPYNFTSADDRLIIRQLFDESVWADVEELRSQRVTGRSARLLMRFSVISLSCTATPSSCGN